MAERVVAASVPEITLEEVLAIKHPDPAVWSSDGGRLAWRWDDGGLIQLWAVQAGGGEPIQVSTGEGSVGGFDWSLDVDLFYTQDRRIWRARMGEAPRQLTEDEGKYANPRCAPSGDALAFTQDGALFVCDPDGGSRQALSMPGEVTGGYAAAPALQWSPGATRLAAIIRDGAQRDVAVVERDGRLVWRTDTPDNEVAFAWIDEERLHVTRMNPAHTVRTHYLVELASGTERELVREESPRGLKGELAPVVAPGGGTVVYVLTPENWPHLFAYDLAGGELRQLTSGDCDDTGHAGDFLTFSPDGGRLVYCSSRDTDLNQRRLWIVDLARGESRLLTPGPGTDSCAAWSPDGSQIAYLHSSPDQSSDIWLVSPEGGEPRQVSRSMPASLTADRLTEPRHLTYPSRDGLQVHADLFLPKGFDESQRYPAVVWVHGGMARQMRYGWHPMHSYALFYSFHQFLLHRGFVILSVDYRGSIGYGREYEEGTYLQMLQGDLDDVVAGADYLRSLPYVDPDGIGVYGLSYGGYLTLGALTKHPDAFAMGLNIAGIWDWPQYEAWRETTYPGSNWQGRARLGGAPGEENADAWYQASPKHFVDGLRVPLLNLMGTEDERVDFTQLDAIIRDCVAHEKDFAALYYPGETHTFTYRRTWHDAFPRITGCFQRYLATPVGQRPPAMI